MSTAPSDIELWNAIRHGSKEALAALFKRYYLVFVRSGILYCHDSDLAKDACHDIFFKMWQNRSTLKDVANVKAYMAITYRNQLITTLRQTSKHDEKLKQWSTEEATHQDSYEKVLVASELKEEYKIKLHRAMNELTPRQKEYLYLKYFEGLNNEQIAKKTGQAIKTIYNTTSEAIRILRRDIKL